MNNKIMVVDDNKLNIRLLEEILKDENYDVYTLDDGSDVLEIARSIKPAAILLDIMMPGIDGFEVCRLLKEDYDTREIPVIMVNAKTEAEGLLEAFDLGAFDYIKKPINEVEVLARLNSALRYRKQQEELKDMAMKDGLTELYNHTLLLELLEKEYEKAGREGNPIAFLMIDIDHFKKINDTYGHLAGDKILKEVADILLEYSRQSDIVGRYGGEEFGIILPDISLKGTEKVSERIRSSVEENEFIVDGQSIKLSVSIGICYNDLTNITGCHDMIKEADSALYRAKEKGRNRVEIIEMN
ncbi:MAG: diguanylate cyclase [Halanaerobiales bacterium]